MELKVSVEIKGALLKKLMSAPEEVGRGLTRAGMINLVEAIEAKAVKLVPVKTSNLHRSITSNVSADGKKGEIRATAPYAAYVHQGTGLWGPFRQLIRPKTKKALFWPGALHPVRSVKGQRPNPFFEKALAQVRSQEVFEAGIWGYLKRLA
jgi:HK97 gp10 family phage protein